MKRFNIGIDGGGTGSTFTFTDVDSDKKTTIRGPSIQLRQMDVQTAAGRIFQIINKHFHSENIKIEQLTAGIAGAGTSDTRILLQDELESALRCRAIIISDAEAAWYSAFGIDKSGLMLINGTGSVMVTGTGDFLELFGGYGPGSHEVLSGRELGRQALRCLAEHLDSETNAEPFISDLMKATKITNRVAMLDYIRQHPAGIAKLAPIVLKHASEHQPEAIHIVNHELNLLRRQLHSLPQAQTYTSIALHGGLFQNKWLRNQLNSLLIKCFGDNSVIFDVPAVSEALVGVTEAIRFKTIRF